MEWRNQDNYDIYIKLIGSGTPQRLTTDPADDSAPAWSPDGKQIAFLRILDSGRFAVILIPSRGGNERKLCELSRVAEVDNTLAWHPEGKYIAISDVNALFLISAKTGEKQRLTTPPKYHFHVQPAFSTDGRSLAFSQQCNYTGDLYMQTLDDALAPQGEPVQLTTGIELASFPVWTADGDEIIFSANIETAPNLWRMMVSDPGKPQRLATVGEGGTFPALSRNGRRLAYTRRIVDRNIWQIKISASGTALPEMAPLINSTKDDYIMQYSPDGSRIAFGSDRSGASEIWICNSDGSNEYQLTFFGGPITGTPRWSPDGKQIVFDSRPEGHSDIFIVDANGGEPRRLTSDPANDLVPSWSRNGKWIYFSSNRGGSNQILKILADDRTLPEKVIQVTQNAGLNVFESYNGKLLYYTKGIIAPINLWQVPVEGGEETLIIESIQSWFAGYALADNGIYFIPSNEAELRFLIARPEPRAPSQNWMKPQ